ncbi:hypothetical protein [Methylobacterium sp. WSM2598]|uniref:hypothetical protein n=1 Tax=Methylobacterium sp. WSM2598 TaxID=398261 RepID=UPI00036780AF|nr:hypothetical protein [Methylobacterium sp. WSM2598]
MGHASDHRDDGPRAPLSRAWDGVLRWLRVLWVCRASAASALAGLVLFTLAGPARDLFMESQPYGLYWTGFFAMVLAWALIVHYAARKVLEQQAWAEPGTPLPLAGACRHALAERYRWPAAWVPRLLGLLCLAAVWLGIAGAAADLAPARRALDLPDPRRLLGFLAVVAVLYAAYVVLRRRLAEPGLRREPWPAYLHDVVTGEGGSLLSEPTPFWFFALATPEGRRRRGGGAGVRGDAVAFLLLAFLVGVWGIAVALPGLLETVTPRALFVVLMLGLPVSLLAFLSALSHALRLPVIALLVLGLFLGTGAVRDFHDLRRLDGPGTVRPGLREAMERWLRLNCRPDDPQPCRARPVILASAGGASRAAFFTATVVGDILADERVDLRRRLFAISGVSGGSVGAAFIRAALDDARPDGGAPCGRVGRAWFRHDARPTGPYTWKECLQALTAGDFLSRPFVGLAFRDLFGFPLHDLVGMADRAVLLERAFEDQYRALVGPEGSRDGGLARALGEEPAGPERWAPRLILNTTSVLDGRRSLVSDLLPFRCDGGADAPLFPTAVDLFETLGAGRSCADGAPAATGAVAALRLSSAATASARFPVISPHAVIRRRAEAAGSLGDAVDLLVDGGYFENDGLTSARQLAEAMQAVWPGFPKAVILHVTNNPTSESSGEGDVAQRSPRRQEFVDGLLAPFRTILATRDGHAAVALWTAQHASSAVEEVLSFQVYDAVAPGAKEPGCALARAPETARGGGSVDRIKDLSMSWWLSGAVQAYLDSQLCHPANRAAYGRLLTHLGIP